MKTTNYDFLMKDEVEVIATVDGINGFFDAFALYYMNYEV